MSLTQSSICGKLAPYNTTGASARTVHSGQPGAPPGVSAAVVTASQTGPVQANATATDDSQNIRPRKQSKEASDKIHQEHHALVCLLKEAQEAGKFKQDYKSGDRLQ